MVSGYFKLYEQVLNDAIFVNEQVQEYESWIADVEAEAGFDHEKMTNIKFTEEQNQKGHDAWCKQMRDAKQWLALWAGDCN